MPEVVVTDISERIGTITLNRPEARNALSSELIRAIPAALAAMEADDAVDVVILTGADPAFCAGLDLKELGSRGTNLSADDGTVDADGVRTPFGPRSKPLIGAVNGPAVTGGLELALNCDLLVASERARFADTHARVGVMPGWGLTVLLPQAVGVRRAREMSLTGNYVDAQTALVWGLVNHVVPHDELMAFARSLAADIVGNDQASVRRLGEIYDEVTSTTVAEGLRLEARHSRAWARANVTPDGVESRRAAIVERGRGQL
jgi:enoyl-CoA hydratase